MGYKQQTDDIHIKSRDQTHISLIFFFNSALSPKSPNSISSTQLPTLWTCRCSLSIYLCKQRIAKTEKSLTNTLGWVCFATQHFVLKASRVVRIPKPLFFPIEEGEVPVNHPTCQFATRLKTRKLSTVPRPTNKRKAFNHTPYLSQEI